MHRERIMNKLTVTQQEQTVSEEQRLAKAVAERDAKQAQQQREEEEKRSAMLKSITAHREFMVTQVHMLHLTTQKKSCYYSMKPFSTHVVGILNGVSNL